MTKHDYKQNAYYLIYLIRCVLNNRIPAKEKLGKMNLLGVFAVAKAHSLTAIVAYALESAGIYDKDFEEEKFKAIRKNIILDVERERVFAEFEKAGIWYLPLKGIVIKDLYPQIGMRQMADNDILIDKNREHDVKSIMINCGFKNVSFNTSKHDVYFKEPVCNFQMHVSLFDSEPESPFYNYYSDIDKRMIKENGRDFGKLISYEDFYLYIKSHEYKHFSSYGTGLRNLVDTYIYLKNYANKMDLNYLNHELEKLQISDYEENCRKISLDLFNGKRLDDSEKRLLDYYIYSGTYGNVQNHINNSVKNNGRAAKTKYFVVRLFLPIRKQKPLYQIFAARYKWFYKNRVRIPLLFFYRLGLAMIRRRVFVLKELKALMNSK